MKNKLLLIETVILTVIICLNINKKSDSSETVKTPQPATSITKIEGEVVSKPSEEIIDTATDTIKQFVKGELTVDEIRERLENYIDRKLEE